MSDAAIAIDMLGWQLHRQHMNMLDRDNLFQTGLIAQNQHLTAEYNKLVARYNALDRSAREAQAAANARIAELEDKLNDAQASAAHWRWQYSELFKSKFQK